MRTPDFFIVGAPKCGTTALNDYLKLHPEIFIPEKKESHFFGTDITSPFYMRDEEQYRALFSEARDEKRVGESSVWYLYSTRAAREIKDFCPEARIIIMLRNPVDMLHSLHSQFLYIGTEDMKDLEAALEAEENRKKGLHLPKAAHAVKTLFYRDVAKYTQQVQRYLHVFGRESVHIIIYDDFKKDTGLVYRETLRFLGVSEGFCPEFKIINANKTVRSKTLLRILTDQPASLRLLARILVPCPLRPAVVQVLQRLNIQYIPRSPMDPDLRRRLQKEFAPEVEQLSDLLGRDLTHWCREELS